MTEVELHRRTEMMGDALRRFARRGARAKISKLLGKSRPEDVAVQMRGLTPAQQVDVFGILFSDYRESAGAVLTEIEAPARELILEGLSKEDLAALLGGMSVDDAVDVVESLPASLQDKVRDLLDVGELAAVQTHLTYDDDSAGRLMDPAFVALDESTRVGEAVAELQRSRELDNVFYLYVIDSRRHLVGVTSLRQLLLSSPERTLGEIMTRAVIKVSTSTDQEEVAKLAARYDLLAIPVTDEWNRLVGIITVDDIIDVVKEEATEDFLKMVGTSNEELVYQERSLRVAGIRLPWLMVNLFGLGLAGTLTRVFEVTLSEAFILVTFMPIIMGMGGNIGSQTSTIAVRGMATGRLSFGQGRMRHFLWQQVKVGALIGAACSLLVTAGALVIDSNPLYAAVIGGSLFLAVLVASINGAAIPMLFGRLGIDPAVASGPLVTTSSDVTGLLIYFGLAGLMIDLFIR